MVKASRQSTYEMDHFIYQTGAACMFVKVKWSLSWLFSRMTEISHITIMLEQMQPHARRTEQLFLCVAEIKLPESSGRRSRKSKLQSIGQLIFSEELAV